MKHIPGPWYVVAEEHVDGVDTAAISTQPNDRSLKNEVLGSSEWLRAEYADLQLMAAAPELLEALKALVSIEHRLDIPQKYFDLMHKAIAKAQGGK